MALRAFRSITKVTATRAGQKPWHKHCQIDLRSFKGYVVVGGTGALLAIARLREATDEAKQKLKGMRQRGLRHPLRCFCASTDRSVKEPTLTLVEISMTRRAGERITLQRLLRQLRSVKRGEAEIVLASKRYSYWPCKAKEP